MADDAAVFRFAVDAVLLVVAVCGVLWVSGVV